MAEGLDTNFRIVNLNTNLQKKIVICATLIIHLNNGVTKPCSEIGGGPVLITCTLRTGFRFSTFFFKVFTLILQNHFFPSDVICFT